MKFFDDYTSFITLKDLPSPTPGREPYLAQAGFKKEAVITIDRPPTALLVTTYAFDENAINERAQRWFIEVHALLGLGQPFVSFQKNTKGQVIGVESRYADLSIRRKVEDFILQPFKLMLNFSFVKRFHLKRLPTASAGKFSDDDTWVRLIVRNDALIFALMVNHEGHDYTLTHPAHLEWAQRLCADLSIEVMDIEYDADLFLSSVEEFERLYDFLTLHAVSSGYH
ncbi:MAG: hypothetical protein J0L53_15120 [Spirochaetes bacterium]|nr:hypothetical protein [Spirochaetota bacterium]MBX3724274.1 hypothetical protein [Turneriella sp.]